MFQEIIELTSLIATTSHPSPKPQRDALGLRSHNAGQLKKGRGGDAGHKGDRLQENRPILEHSQIEEVEADADGEEQDEDVGEGLSHHRPRALRRVRERNLMLGEQPGALRTGSKNLGFKSVPIKTAAGARRLSKDSDEELATPKGKARQEATVEDSSVSPIETKIKASKRLVRASAERAPRPGLAATEELSTSRTKSHHVVAIQDLGTSETGPKNRPSTTTAKESIGKDTSLNTDASEKLAIIRGKEHRDAIAEDLIATTSSESSKICRRNATRGPREQPSRSCLKLDKEFAIPEGELDGHGLGWKGKAKDVGAPSTTKKGKKKAPTSQSSAQSPPTLLETTHRALRPKRNAAKVASTHQLALNKKTIEHLKPLTDVEGVTQIRDIDQWHAEWTSLCTMTKIAEGSYGSVFLMSDKKATQRATIGKLMPLRAAAGVGSRKVTNTRVADAVSEVRLLELMNDVPGFVGFRGADVLVGALPPTLRAEYAAYQARQPKSTSESSSSEGETWYYPRQQAWVFIEMDDAGVELDRALSRRSEDPGLLLVGDKGVARHLPVRRTRDVFWGVVEALARGEVMHRFEHRDLHTSNICVQRQGGEEDSGDGLVPAKSNLVVTIIDYTLSRASLPSVSSPSAALFHTMLDPSLFIGEGDPQFDIYRHMREFVGAVPDPCVWAAYVPLTNALWLSFLLGKLMEWTPRPAHHGGEQALWDALVELQGALRLEDRWGWDFLSAAEVARWMEVGREAFLAEVRDGEEDGAVGGEDEGRVIGLLRGARREKLLQEL